MDMVAVAQMFEGTMFEGANWFGMAAFAAVLWFMAWSGGKFSDRQDR